MRRESGRAHLDGKAEIVKARDQALGELGLVAAIEVVGTEVTVIDAVFEHVVGGGQHGGGDGEDGLLGASPALDSQELSPEVGVLFRAADHAACTSVVFSQGLLDRVRFERRLPALSWSRGQRPAQETRWPAVGKWVISKPISATMTRATVSLTPGIVIRRSTAARKGVRASPRRASTSRTAASSASIWVRCSLSMKR